MSTSSTPATGSPEFAPVHWFRRGEGVVQVLLHGFAGSVLSWQEVAWQTESFACWESSTGKESGPLVAVALPGHHPDAPVGEGFEDNVDWLAKTIRMDGISRCHLIGYSMGARLALGIAARHPGIISALTLIGVHPGLTSTTERADRVIADARWAEILRKLGVTAFVDAWEKLPLFASQSCLAPQVLEQQRRIRLAHDPNRLADAMERCGLARMPVYQAVFSRLKVPVQLVVGELDQKFVAIAKSIIKENSNVVFSSVAGVGHNVVLEAPGSIASLLLRCPDPRMIADYSPTNSRT